MLCFLEHLSDRHLLPLYQNATLTAILRMRTASPRFFSFCCRGNGTGGSRPGGRRGTQTIDSVLHSTTSTTFLDINIAFCVSYRANAVCAPLLKRICSSIEQKSVSVIDHTLITLASCQLAANVVIEHERRETIGWTGQDGIPPITG